MPTVSVVMAVRNGEAYLREAVDSILVQTLTDFEFVIVDDGSTDRTTEILASYSDARIRVISQPGRGLAPSLNIGIRASRSALIARMDADDVSEPRRLERQADFLAAHGDHVLVGSDVTVFAEDGENLFRAALLTDNEGIGQCLAQFVTPFYHGAVMFRRDAAVGCGLYDERVPQQVEDVLLWLRLQRLGALANFPEPLYRYRFRENSLSRQSRTLLDTKARVVREYHTRGTVRPDDLRTLTAPPSRLSGRASRANYALDLGKIFLDQADNVPRARRELARAVMLAPASPRAWLNLGLSYSPAPIRSWRIKQRNRRIHLRAERAP